MSRNCLTPASATRYLITRWRKARASAGIRSTAGAEAATARIGLPVGREVVLAAVQEVGGPGGVRDGDVDQARLGAARRVTIALVAHPNVPR